MRVDAHVDVVRYSALFKVRRLRQFQRTFCPTKKVMEHARSYVITLGMYDQDVVVLGGNAMVLKGCQSSGLNDAARPGHSNNRVWLQGTSLADAPRAVGT